MRKFSLFISDLHLDQEDPVIMSRFIEFMERVAPQAEYLYILGDFFETWIGDDDKTPFNHEISRRLKSLNKEGIPIYFMHGNRDFLIGKKYASQSGFEIIPDPCVITLYNKRIVLTHGDMLCTNDIRHQKYRNVMLNPKTQFCLLHLPLWVRRKIAKRLRQKSGQHHKHAPSYIMDITETEAIKLLQSSDSNLMIHGHTHRPKVHIIQQDNTRFTRVVLGAWHDNADYLKLYADGEYELMTM